MPRRAVPAGAVRRATAAVGAFAAGYVVYRTQTTLPLDDVLRVQCGGSSQPLPLPEGTREDVLWDLALVAGYGSSFLLAAPLASSCVAGPRGRTIGSALRWLAAGAVVADLTEDLLVLLSLRPTLEETDVRAVLSLVHSAATVKFVCFIPAALLGAGLVAWTYARAHRGRSSRLGRARG